MQTEKLFTETGGRFAKDIGTFRQKLTAVRALIFDWDGVFNEGYKTGAGHSGFAEADSMGINLLRFGFWLRDGGKLPYCAILSGAMNDMARLYAQREHFHAIRTSIKQKDNALLELQTLSGTTSAQTAFFFDDIIDLQAALTCHLKIFFPKKATPLTKKFVTDHNLYDYMPGNPAGNFALREVCELMLSAMGLFDTVVKYRMQFTGPYEQYLHERNAINPDG